MIDYPANGLKMLILIELFKQPMNYLHSTVIGNYHTPNAVTIV